MFFEWDDDYSVNIREIDNQHKRLVELINELDDAFDSDEKFEVVRDVLKRLRDYIKEHFSYEEGLLVKYGYENIKEHMDQHMKFIVKIRELSVEACNGGNGVFQELLDFLMEWLINHILESDMQYSRFLINEGVS